jgi:formylglycine-generating enzyme required for sulfatase activity/DNA-binding winged helix-turn-helix (wHTH) protein
MDPIVEDLRFDRFTLDLMRGSLRIGDQEIELRPKTFGVLLYLARNAGRLVPKQELAEAVWPNVYVSDDSLAQCIRELRDKLGDDEHRLIKTAHRRGYLLDAAVMTAGPQRPPAEMTADGEAPLVPTADAPLGNRVSGGGLPAGQRPRETGVLPWRAMGLATAVLILAGLASVSLLPRATMPIGDSGQPAKLSTTAAVAQSPGPTFRDCDVCPEMVELPPGAFIMGSPEDEPHRLQTEGPQRRVVIAKRFAFGAYEVTVDQFATFLAESGHAVGETCEAIDMAAAKRQMPNAPWHTVTATFRHPGFEVSGSHPAVCVSWHDAKAYAAWLSRRTGRPYRLATEAEWEYAARAGTGTSFSFGDDDAELCRYVKFADLGSPFPWGGGCRGTASAYGTAPVGSFKPNPWGLFDIHGNAWEWVEDCWRPNLREGPADGSALLRPGGCEVGVLRGGSFASGAQRVRSAIRSALPAARRQHHVGFRVALSLDPP